MNGIEELRQRLRALDVQEEDIARKRAELTRALVDAAGGLNPAAELLKLDPRTVSKRTRLDDIAMVVYRRGAELVDDDGRLYGETSHGDAAQRTADAQWWRVDKKQRPKVRLLVVVFRGEVRRIWRVLPDGQWRPKGDGSTFVEVPVEDQPLTAAEVREHYPRLGLNLGGARPMRQGLIREYLPVDGKPPAWVLDLDSFDPNDPDLQWSPPAGSLT
ncbi:hypothetical protein [Streptomyces sp. NPDC058247]|uniref:hypothetical protein n=1 Tax=Streptomyces sp. NPDC058247 TaxID=3346401 RepID=UPI0036E072E9